MGKMTSGMRMLAMARAAQGERREYEHGRMQEGGGMSMMDAPEMRRRRDSRGRYMEGDGGTRMENGGAPSSHMPWHEPPYLNGPRNQGSVLAGNAGRMNNEMTRMTEDVSDVNPYAGEPEHYRQQREDQTRSEMRKMTGEKSSGGEITYNRGDGGYGNVRYFMHKTDPMNQHDGKDHFEQPRQIGFQQHEQSLDKDKVMELVESMEDGEGVRGGKYTWHQVQQYAMNMGITGQQRMVEFYWAMNAMYADFHKVGKKFGVDKPEFYAHLAKCFIEDPDAKDNKVEEYIKHVVKSD